MAGWKEPGSDKRDKEPQALVSSGPSILKLPLSGLRSSPLSSVSSVSTVSCQLSSGRPAASLSAKPPIYINFPVVLAMFHDMKGVKAWQDTTVASLSQGRHLSAEAGAFLSRIM